MKKIDKLTDEQKAKMSEWADKWIKIGLSTEEADWKGFEKGVRKCYEFAGLNPNVPIIRVQSPIVGALAAPIAANIICSIEEMCKALSEVKEGFSSSVKKSKILKETGNTWKSKPDNAVKDSISDTTLNVVRKELNTVDSNVCEEIEKSVDTGVQNIMKDVIGDDSNGFQIEHNNHKNNVANVLSTAINKAIRNYLLYNKANSKLTGVTSNQISDASKVINSIGNGNIYTTVRDNINYFVTSSVNDAIGIMGGTGQDIDNSVQTAVHETVNYINDFITEASKSTSRQDSILSSVFDPALQSIDNSTNKDTKNAFNKINASEDISIIIKHVLNETLEKVIGNKQIFWHNWIGGRFWSYWQAYVTFFTDVCGWTPGGDILKRIKAYELAQKSAGYWWPNEHFIMVCNAPKEINRNAEGRLHKDGGMAISWRDGWGLHFLNGVKVSKELAETLAGKLDAKKVIEEKNADIQREGIRKIGAERMLKALDAKPVDTYKDITGYTYYLYEMKLNNMNRKYLYFEHASMKGVFYAKPVPIETKKALHGRAWILSMIERDKLKDFNEADEAELIANLPQLVS